MPAKPIEIVFHIGLERTGTTSIQKVCARHADQLLARGILYPTKSLAFRKFNHGPLAAAYLPQTSEDDIYLLPCQMGRDALLRSLFEEIDASGAHTVLLSSEYFSSRFGAGVIRQLAEDFSKFSCRVSLVLRDHLSRLISGYSTHVISESAQTFDEYTEAMLHPQSHQLRYRRVVEMWQSAFGAENVTVLDYSEDDMVNRLFAALGLEAGRFSSKRRFRYNRSLNAVSTEAIRLTNRQITAIQTSGGPLMAESVVRLMLKWCGRLIQGRSTPWVLSERNRALLSRLVSADADWVSTHCGLALPSGRDWNTTLTREGALVAARDRRALQLAERLQIILKPYFALVSAGSQLRSATKRHPSLSDPVMLDRGYASATSRMQRPSDDQSAFEGAPRRFRARS